MSDHRGNKLHILTYPRYGVYKIKKRALCDLRSTEAAHFVAGVVAIDMEAQISMTMTLSCTTNGTRCSSAVVIVPGSGGYIWTRTSVPRYSMNQCGALSAWGTP